MAENLPAAFAEWSVTDNAADHEQSIEIIHRRRCNIAVGAAAPAAIATEKSGQFTWPLFAMMVADGAVGALGTLFPSLKSRLRASAGIIERF